MNTLTGCLIRTIEYSRLRSFGSYENERIGATMDVVSHHPDGPTDDDINQCLSKLIGWVDGRIAEREKAEKDAWMESREQDAKRREIAEIDASLEVARVRWEKAKAFLERHGLPIDIPEDIPF